MVVGAHDLIMLREAGRAAVRDFRSIGDAGSAAGSSGPY
jgi:hypothetical protein